MKKNLLVNCIAFVVITLAVLGGYALYKGSFSFSINDGIPKIDAADYKNAEPIDKIKNLSNKIINFFR